MDGINDQDPALIFPGPVALVAGPGSGKTTRLARRIKHLVEDRGANPEEITVITFTREAARNMKERLTPPAKDGMPDVTLPSERHPSTICTMHSLGWTIIGENAARLGMPPECRPLPTHMRQLLFEDAARLCGKDNAFGWRCADRKSKLGEPEGDEERQVFDAYRRKGDANFVRIMTMRNSKGLEAETVFVIGLEEGAFPSSDRGTDQFEEDARLFYVSMTRAKKELHLFHARTRSGGMTYKPKSYSMNASPFLGGLPEPHRELKYHQPAARRAAKK